MNIVFLQKNTTHRAVFNAACSLDYVYPSWAEKKQFQFRVKGLSPLRI